MSLDDTEEHGVAAVVEVGVDTDVRTTAIVDQGSGIDPKTAALARSGCRRARLMLHRTASRTRFLKRVRSAFCASRRSRPSCSEARRVCQERAAAQISFASCEKELPRAQRGPAGVQSHPRESVADDESATSARTTERR
jgi:hypothetical protein